MRLDPIFLVAPDAEEPRARFSRRTLLVAAIGVFGVGVLAGRALRTRNVLGGADAGVNPEDETWIRWGEDIQQQGVEKLLANRAQFLTIVAFSPNAAQRLAVGVHVLVKALDRESDRLGVDESAATARAILQALDNVGVASAGVLLSQDELESLRVRAR